MDDWLDLSTVVERTQEFIDMGLYDEARQVLDSYADFYRDEWEIHFLYSRICTERNEPREAIRHLQKAVRIDAGNLDCLLGLFYSFAQLNRIQRGIRYLRKAEQAYPRHELVLNALIWYHTETCDFETAVAYYEEASGILDRSPEALRNIGIAYERLGDHESARACYARALDINPHFDEVRDLLADQYILGGLLDQSIALYREYLSRSPNNIKALSRLVFCLAQNNQTDEAERTANATIQLYPNSPVGYVDLAYVYLNSQRHDLALDAVNRALDVSPIDAEALRVKAITLSEKGEHDKAEDVFDEALSLDPANPEIARDYYQHLRDAEKIDRMLSLVHSVIAREKPYCVEDYWFLADHYRDAGKDLLAFHYLRKAYKSMPGERELIPPMVDILLDMGHISFAVPFLKRYVEAKGWNEVMDGYTRHRGLKGKWPQESLRFLRFYGQRPRAFREFVFGVYFRRFLTAALAVIVPFLLAFALLFFKTTGFLVVVSMVVAALVSFHGARMILHRQRRSTQSPAHEPV
ncbi:MAG: tetratricopeptide repeat protein [Chitinivibrionales bacterium]|nr:tetratricopeptide repeat protein [Chitinivibrionales bacterium]MBD3395508.1 tetratricopeptide repeat protein [Chitinivibrionales bacterium]